MAGIPRMISIAACCVLLNSAIGAVQVPNTTYTSNSFDKIPIKTVIERLGFKHESYKVTTSDGYILNLNRVINPYLAGATNYGVPILLVHGLATQAVGWFLQAKPELNIPVAYLLAGYDVWIGDARGTLPSRKHVNLTVKDWRYWDFSFHEMGVYDLPAFIDFILDTTGQPKLAYSGMSSGGAVYYVMCVEKPEYQDKLYGGILWAPVGESPDVASIDWTATAEVLFGQAASIINWRLGIGEVPPLLQYWKRHFNGICKAAPANGTQIGQKVFGRGCQFQGNVCFQLLAILGGTSSKTVIHTDQLFSNGGVFRNHNYGKRGNLLKYGQVDPPIYDISRLKVFTALYASDTDNYAPARTVVSFSKKFSGPTYLCEITGVCHIFGVVDFRAGPYVQDSIEVLNSMTGRTSPHKMYSKRCNIRSPTF